MNQPFLYIITLSLLLVTGCSFIANANSSSDEKGEDLQPEYHVDLATDITEFDEYHMTIHYPKTQNNKIDQMIIDYTNERKAEFKRKSYEALQNQDPKKAHELHIDFEVLHQDGAVFVVLFEEVIDLGTGNPIESQTVMNFDKDKGTLLKAEDFLREDSTLTTSLADESFAWTKNGLAIYQSTGKELVDQTALKPKYADLLKTIKGTSHDTAESDVAKEWPSAALSNRAKASEQADKRVALTFDDGPHPKVTVDVLDVLEEREVEATFFMIGKRVQYYPEVAQAVSKAGHEIGNHTWNHARVTRLTSEEVDEQIERTQQVIGEAVGYTPTIIRLPFGEQMAFNQELHSVSPNVTIENSKDKSPEEMALEVVTKVKDGSIIMLSDLDSNTVEAVDLIIEKLSAEGYDFVPAHRLAK
ncbi:polysaccharide deacetylase family protein [Halobacillus litoralis]|uniref:polysaccharide deacetylase family protein n=1 Tax=Halobacillus litoralis TaxID=45668 RepID=UPI001CD1CD95|nr:polysaccharide deacetylase family protein [Halobacillus litoralis]MCA0971160.1 polysaccharide deacetylase family protein [Halobacillus litoralis]